MCIFLYYVPIYFLLLNFTSQSVDDEDVEAHNELYIDETTANLETSSPTLASPNPRATNKRGSALTTVESLDEAQQRRLAQRKHDDLVS